METESKCPRDCTNEWVYSGICKGYICKECILDGMYREDIVEEYYRFYPKENKDERNL